MVATKKSTKLTGAQVASRAGKILGSPRSTKAQKSVAASALAQRSWGKITRKDTIFQIVSIGRSGVAGGLSKKKR